MRNNCYWWCQSSSKIDICSNLAKISISVENKCEILEENV